jgi:heme o synthase
MSSTQSYTFIEGMRKKIMFGEYYRLTKPGIIRGNAITAAAGFLLASNSRVDFSLFAAAVGGISLIIASACVFNNILDREIDAKMKRTKKRALVTGAISVKSAMFFAIFLGISGSYILLRWTNNLTYSVALLGLIFYVIVYGYAKRNSVQGTVVGSISGAVPPVVGYCAVTNRIDSGALMLFIILVLWQMPHFYAIALYRTKEYASASIPVLPIINGVQATKLQILGYMIAFLAAINIFTLLGHTGYTYSVVMSLVSLAWIRLGLKGFNNSDTERWARKVFGFSLLVLLVFSLMISLNAYLP